MSGDRRSIVEWGEDEVQKWLVKLGYPQYESQIKEHRISGDILCMIDSETLKKIGIAKIGQRLAILKAVYNLKIAHSIPLAIGDYVPPSEVQEYSENVPLEKLSATIKDQEHRLRVLEEENHILHSTLQTVLDDYNSLRASLGLSRAQDDQSSPIKRHPSFKRAQFKALKSAELDTPNASPQQLEQAPPYYRARQYPFPSPSDVPDKSRTQTVPSGSPSIRPRTIRQDSIDNLKNYKVSLEDPTWKVLPAALKKCRINNDNWENYEMFIDYGTPGNRIERRLDYDEKPLLLFQKLKEAEKQPIFTLKYIKVNPVASSDSVTENTGHSLNQPSKLEVNDIQTTPSASADWPDRGAVSPGDHRGEESLSQPPKAATSAMVNGPDGLKSSVPSTTGVSYVV